MSLPSQDIPASRLWLKLQEIPRPTKVIDFPRMGPDGKPVGQLAIRILTQEEQMICSAAAEEFAHKHLKNGKKDDLGYERVYSDAICVELLFRACRDADNPGSPAFPTPKHLREMLSTEECARLFDNYLTVQLELGPTVSQMTDEQVEAWIDRLVEGGSAFPFDSLSSELQKIVLLYMAYQLRSSQMDKSSVGLQPEESTPNE